MFVSSLICYCNGLCKSTCTETLDGRSPPPGYGNRRGIQMNVYFTDCSSITMLAIAKSEKLCAQTKTKVRNTTNSSQHPSYDSTQ